MLELSSSRWGDLGDAYGSAARIPELLRQLSALPDDDGSSEPWFSLWSALAHQGDVYSASLQRFHTLSQQSLAHQNA